MRKTLAAGFVMVLALVALFALPLAAYGAPLYVSVVGSDTTGDGSLANPYETVQHAVDVAVSGDVVEVGSGTFYGTFLIKDGVSLHGAGAGNTVLTETGGAPVVTAGAVGASTSVSDFTISGNGHGIYCINGSTLTITRNEIIGNVYSGISCLGASPSINGNDIIDNLHGIFCVGGSPTIDNNVIRYNDGSGIGCNGSSPNIINSDIYGNDQGIYLSGGSPSILNDNIWGNNYEGIYCGTVASPVIVNDTIFGNSTGIECDAGSSASIKNCIVWNPGATELTGCSASYSDIAGGAAGTGNINAEPSFVDAAARDFHLAAGSPCIDVGTSAGAPAVDKDGVSRPQISGYDMGAYEYVPTCRLHYAAGLDGSIVGLPTQTVNYNGSGSPVTASPTLGYHFVEWSDHSVANPRTDANVTSDATYTASFAINTSTLALARSTASPAYDSKVTLSATLVGNGAAAVGQTVIFERLATTGWVQVGTATTGAGGVGVLSVKPYGRAKTVYRARFAATAAYAAAMSANSVVTPKVYLTKGNAPKTMYKRKVRKIYGYLKPRHTSGSTSAVRIYRYKKNSKGIYVKYDHVHAKLSNYSTYSKYTKPYSFPSRGKWRVRAYAPADSKHAATWSGYDYVSVK